MEPDVIIWPFSQICIGCRFGKLVMSESGMEKFGSSAYICKKGIEPAMSDCDEREELGPDEEMACDYTEFDS